MVGRGGHVKDFNEGLDTKSFQENEKEENANKRVNYEGKRDIKNKFSKDKRSLMKKLGEIIGDIISTARFPESRLVTISYQERAKKRMNEYIEQAVKEGKSEEEIEKALYKILDEELKKANKEAEKMATNLRNQSPLEQAKTAFTNHNNIAGGAGKPREGETTGAQALAYAGKNIVNKVKKIFRWKWKKKKLIGVLMHR